MQPPQQSYVTFELPDLAYWHLIGRVEESDIIRIYEQQLEFSKDKPYILLVIDVSRFESISAAARRAAATGPNPGQEAMPVRGSAIIGASFHVRVLGILISKAAFAINRSKDNDLHFCETAAQARDWVEKRRRELRKT